MKTVVYSEEQLRKMKYQDIYDLCTKYKLPKFTNRGRISKATMIDNILLATGSPKRIVVLCTKEDIDNASIGSLLAFRVNTGKALSGKLKARSKKREQLKVETKKGDSFVVDYENVLCFKNDSPWPKWVYEELKG